MRKIIPVVIFLAAFSLFSQKATLSWGLTLKEGDNLRDLSLKGLGGEEIHLASFDGKVVILTFWSTWCSRCREEMSFLKKISRSFGDVEIIAVNQEAEEDINIDEIRNFLEEMGGNFHVALDEGYRLWDRFGINALPTTVILDERGTVRFAESNFYFASPEKIEETLTKLCKTGNS